MRITSLYRFIILAAVTITGFTACRKDDDLSKPILGLEGDTWTKTPLDEWLYNNFTKPYNVEVKYRWDATELGISNTLVPPDTSKVRPLMEVVKKAWIDVYVEEAGEAFVKQLAPKQYVLVGSLQYNGSTVTLGEAEGGRKVTLFNVNNFTTTDREKVKRILKTIHHEFAHILHQTVMYPVEFKLITPGGYTSNWNQISTAAARESGFITSYSQADPNEDFVEMAAIMITEGRTGYNDIINSISSANAKAILKQKEDIVVTYYKQVWNIDIFRLMDLCQEALDEIVPPPPPPALHTQFGFGKAYTSILAEPATIAALSADFQAAYTAAKNNLFTNAAGRNLDAVYFQFIDNGKGSLRVRYINAAGSAFLAFFGYNVVVDANGVATFTFTGNLTNTNTNSNTVGPYLGDLLNYFSGSFTMEWPGGAPAATPPLYGGFYKVSNPASYFYGVLGN